MSSDFNYNQMVFYNMASNGDNYWFCHCYYNAIYRFDLKRKDYFLETFFPVTGDLFSQYGDIKYWDGKLFLIPRNAMDLLVYDLINKKFNQIKLDRVFTDDIRAVNLFTKSVIKDNYLYLFPGRYHAIVKLNLTTFELTYHSRWFTELKNYIKNPDLLIFSDIHNRDDVVFLSFWQGNKVMRFSLETDEYNIMTIGENDFCYSSIVSEGEYLWIAEKNSEGLYRYNLNKAYFEKIDLPEEFNNLGWVRYLKLYRNNIYIFPQKHGHILRFDLEEQVFSSIVPLKLKPEKDMLNLMFLEDAFLGVSICDDKLFTYSTYDGMIYCINTVNQTMEKFSAQIKKLPSTFNSGISNSFFSENNTENVFCESRALGIRWLIAQTENSVFFEKKDNRKSNIGKTIYKLFNKTTV